MTSIFPAPIPGIIETKETSGPGTAPKADPGYRWDLLGFACDPAVANTRYMWGKFAEKPEISGNPDVSKVFHAEEKNNGT